MRAGLLDRVIRLERLRESFDGDPTTGVWESEAEVWCEHVDGTRDRRVISDQDLATADRVFRIRWRPEVVPARWRVVDEYGGIWQVNGVREGEGRRAETLLFCDRHDPQDRETDAY